MTVSYSVSTNSKLHARVLMIIAAINEREEVPFDDEAADAFDFILASFEDYIRDDNWFGVMKGVDCWRIVLRSLDRSRDFLQRRIDAYEADRGETPNV